MKSLLSTALMMLAVSVASRADTFVFPRDKRPEIDLVEACNIVRMLIRSQGDENRYSIHNASLRGNKKQDGAGAWILWCYDKKGNYITVTITFPNRHYWLRYFPRDYETNGGKRVLEFDRLPKLKDTDPGPDLKRP